MAHTKQSAARAVKRDFAQCIARGNHRVAQNDEPEPGDLDEAALAEIDRQYGIRQAADPLRQAECDRAQSLELARDPLGGYCS